MSVLLVIALISPSGLAHANFLSLITSAFASSGPDAQDPEPAPEPNSQTMPLLQAVASPDPKAATSSDITIDDAALEAETGPSGTAADLEDDPSPSDQISVYVVRKGDTVKQIAEMYDVSVNTIVYTNDLKKDQVLTEGQTLIILPVTGVRYTIKKGDTLASIAKLFGLPDSEDIQAFNGVTNETTLSIGEVLIIPGVEISSSNTTTAKPKTSSGSSKLPSSPKSSTSAAGYYIKPIPCDKTQGKHDRYAVDLSCHTSGTSIRAAADGIVIFAKYGWNGAFGNLMIIAHPNGTQTFYAHILPGSFKVSQGQHVSQGQVIAQVGNTGRSTGAHLHFEVRGAYNPGWNNSWKPWSSY